MRIGISTGGGDAPGLNAAVRGVVLAALHRGWEVVGIRRGFGGLLESGEKCVPLGRDEVRGIAHVGGTILGTTNRGNPFQWPASSGTLTDRSDELISRVQSLRLDAVVLVGGDGTMRIARDLWRKGLPVVGIPKTIDNDVHGTAATIGFDTAVGIATEAIDRLHSTAESHERVMVVEVMGRYAGWIALNSGIAGGADVILIPEMPFDPERIAEKIRQRDHEGRRFAIVVAAEGALPLGGRMVLREAESGGHAERLGGIGEQVCRDIASRTGKETRSLTLGHLQRGGSPTTFDRLLALRFGTAAVRAVEAGAFGRMVALVPPQIATIALEEAVSRSKHVPLDSDTVLTARDMGICLGDC
jgi:6-phosphofructokinase 1